MKTLIVNPLLVALAVILFGGITQGQDDPKVYVSAKGTENVSTNASAGGNRWFISGHSESTIDAHDEGMEVTKDLQKECSGITVTFSRPAADYTVMLDRESKRKRSVFLTNSQVQVLNRIGDVIGSNATRTVNAASKNACSVILADWAKHGRIDAPSLPIEAEKRPAQVPIAAPVSTQSQSHPIEGYTLSSSTSDVGSVSGEQMSLGDAARLAKAKKQQQEAK